MKAVRTFFTLFIFAVFTVDLVSGLETAAYRIASEELENSLTEIGALESRGEWLEAKEQYKTLLKYELSDADRMRIRKHLDDLNLKLLFSPVLTPDSFFYTVKPGDSLYQIAKEFNTTIELLQKSNNLSTDLIRPDMKLKVSKAKYNITVNKSENILQLFADGELLKIYPVATGIPDASPTPVGTFTIESKLVDPVWYKAGAVVPADSPENILGSRWLGFSLPGYGIHGTTLPETIGQKATAGCIRMHNRDVEELFAIVPRGTLVTVID